MSLVRDSQSKASLQGDEKQVYLSEVLTCPELET